MRASLQQAFPADMTEPQCDLTKAAFPSEDRGPSVRTLFGALTGLEAREGLFDWTVSGVHPWPLVRHLLFNQALKHHGLFEDLHHAPATRGLWARRQTARLWRAAAHHPALTARPAETVFVLHGRKAQAADGRMIDPYLDALIARTPAPARAVFDYEDFDGRFAVTPGLGQPSLDSIFLATGIGARAMGRRLFRDDDLARLDALERLVTEALAPGLPVQDLAMREIRRFRVLRSLYARLFRRLRAKRLVTVTAYCRHAMIAGAEAEGLETIEVQHGAMGPYHAGYSFAWEGPVPYTPRLFLSWGPLWTAQTPLPRGTQVRVMGAPGIAQRIAAHKGAPRTDDVAVISQGSIGVKLAPYAKALAAALPGRQVLFRPHPSEDTGRLAALLGLGENAPGTLRLITRDEEPDTLALQARCAVQVGVYSTAVYEGLALGCRTVIADLPGAEYMDGLVAQGEAIRCADPAEAAEAIRSDAVPLPQADPFAETALSGAQGLNALFAIDPVSEDPTDLHTSPVKVS